ncbi:zinc transporter 7 [Neolamprologus brichardi]|uniref:zinc transporter 7 n=1 Tax=Neolamprologus brichardi TaxID=32507 RepID=UPI0016438B57|nr:zinc transporter 7 [Neolamprologus brichardi]
MFFDCTALLAGLAASVISRWRSNDSFSYGYVRAEVLAGFVNGLFLIFTAFFIFSEGVERALEPPDVHHERLLPVSVAGLLVNLVGIFAFQHGGHGHSHGEGDHGHSHSLFNGSTSHGHSHGGHHHHDKHADCHSHGGHHHHDKHADCHSHGGHHHHDKHADWHSHGGHHHHDKHADWHSHGGHEEPHYNDELQHLPGKGSSKQILQVLECFSPKLWGLTMQSALRWLLLGTGITQLKKTKTLYFLSKLSLFYHLILSVVPLLKESIGILMQRTPFSLDHALPECYQRVQQLQGVYNLQEPHFWTLCTDVYIGTLKLLVAPDADTRWILSQTHNIFTQAGVRQLYVQIDTAAM